MANVVNVIVRAMKIMVKVIKVMVKKAKAIANGFNKAMVKGFQDIVKTMLAIIT